MVRQSRAHAAPTLRKRWASTPCTTSSGTRKLRGRSHGSDRSRPGAFSEAPEQLGGWSGSGSSQEKSQVYTSFAKPDPKADQEWPLCVEASLSGCVKEKEQNGEEDERYKQQQVEINDSERAKFLLVKCTKTWKQRAKLVL